MPVLLNGPCCGYPGGQRFPSTSLFSLPTRCDDFVIVDKKYQRARGKLNPTFQGHSAVASSWQWTSPGQGSVQLWEYWGTHFLALRELKKDGVGDFSVLYPFAVGFLMCSGISSCHRSFRNVSSAYIAFCLSFSWRNEFIALKRSHSPQIINTDDNHSLLLPAAPSWPSHPVGAGVTEQTGEPCRRLLDSKLQGAMVWRLGLVQTEPKQVLCRDQPIIRLNAIKLTWLKEVPGVETLCGPNLRMKNLSWLAFTLEYLAHPKINGVTWGKSFLML